MIGALQLGEYTLSEHIIYDILYFAALVNTVTNLRVRQQAGNFLTSSGTTDSQEGLNHAVTSLLFLFV